MPRTAAAFKQTSLTRAIKAVRAGGLEVTRTEITLDGQKTLIVLIHSLDAVTDPAQAAYDAWKAKRNARSS